jgi:hypothetical protein
MHDRLTNRGQAIVDELETIWNKADEEDRGLSRRERARVETLLEKAESFKERRRVDAEIREVLGGGPLRGDPGRPQRRPRFGLGSARQVDRPPGREDQGRGSARRADARQVELELVQEKVRQVAATISNVPNAILNADVTLRAFLSVQMQVKLDQALDAHVVQRSTPARARAGRPAPTWSSRSVTGSRP